MVLAWLLGVPHLYDQALEVWLTIVPQAEVRGLVTALRDGMFQLATPPEHWEAPTASGIKISGSHDVAIFGNTLVGNARQVGVYDDPTSPELAGASPVLLPPCGNVSMPPGGGGPSGGGRPSGRGSSGPPCPPAGRRRAAPPTLASGCP